MFNIFNRLITISVTSLITLSRLIAMKFTSLFLFLALILSLTACNNEPEEPLVLQEGEITNDFHREHIGQITFMGNYIPMEDYSEKDFLSSIQLNEKTNLNMRTYLGKTIAWYLHELEPELSVEDLCAKGNIQYTFYVDDKLIYQENLPIGAGGPWFKTTPLVFAKPLASTEEEDSWGRFLWMRFMKKGGGEDALESGSHDMKIEIRPYIETDKLKVGKIIASGNITIERGGEKPVGENLIAIQKIQEGSTWKVSEAAYDVAKIREMNKRIAQKRYKDISGIAVIKNGELLIEEYFNDANRETKHDPRSVGKTFASTVMGIAIEEGHIKNENQTLKEFYDLKNFDNYSDKKGEVTLKSLLMMSSAFEGSDDSMDSPGNEEYMYPTKDWVKFTLDLDMSERAVGEKWDYFTAGVVVLGDILHQKVPGGLEKYADEKLFEPLGISEYNWEYTPQKVANTAGGIRLRLLDFAKYGQLYKNGGKWNDQQIIPEKWVAESLSRLTPIPKDMGAGYGYLFWNRDYTINGKTYQAAYCSGNGGNKIYVFKELPLVIVIAATAYGQPYMHFQVEQMMEKHILPAVIED